MKLSLVGCFVLMGVVRTQQQYENDFYEPQTFRRNIEAYQQKLFKPNQQATQNSNDQWRPHLQERSDVAENRLDWRPEPWRAGPVTKEQTASILHHKQALTSDGNFRYEFSADNGVAAGEVISPDGTRTGAYQYKDPSGQIVKLKYRAGKEGFQILEGSHLPKSPEPVSYPYQGEHYQQAYGQQRQQYELQQNYNRQEVGAQKMWTQAPVQTYQQGHQRPAQNHQQIQGAGAGNQYFIQNWPMSHHRHDAQNEQEDDGQYRENDLDQRQGQSVLEANQGSSAFYEPQGPHHFGEGYSFEFKG